jgi:glutamate-ammonia-ligase adenylyltransferase
MLGPNRSSRLAICALGKFGGQELGFASDIELMFIYDADGQTAGPAVISNQDFYHKLVDRFLKAIESKRKGIFEVDLRLRPYGNAGNLAVSLASFEKYFGPEGPAWPYERQALVKLRPITGDREFCHTIERLRDSLIYRGEVFDVAAMRAMRERQVRQLVKAGSFNAKLSPGGLVDCEYLVQGLQISFGHMSPALRHPNTRQAMKALEMQGILSREDRLALRDAYRFLRRLIDALRMVRGDASDLTVPLHGTDQFEFLARRLGYESNSSQLKADLEAASSSVLELNRLLDQLCAPR